MSFGLRKFIERRGEDGEADDTELWMLPYSTLMLVLVILFIMFYAFSRFQSVEYETALSDLASTDPSDPRMVQVRQEIALARNIQEFIRKNGMENNIQLAITPHHIKIKMESIALFDSGSAELKTGILFFLEHLHDQLVPMSNSIIAEGHTDNVPIHTRQYDSNWELSAARAFSVIFFFISKGLPPERLIAHGFGEHRPAGPNDTEDGRTKNRRIELTVVRGAKG